MVDVKRPVTPSPAAALKAAGMVGLWETDAGSGYSVLDRDAAAVMAGDPHLAGRPLLLDAALARIHPADRDWVFARIRRVRQTGGSFSAEFRIVEETGEIRWILNRGALTPGSDGTMQGRGVYIDTTDNHRGSFLGEPPADARLALSEAAAHCLRAQEALDRSDQSFLRLLVRMLQLEIGRALARRLHS